MTIVGPQHTCASACFLVFAAGVGRTAFESARIGVHSVSDSGDDNLLAQAFTTLFARDAAAYGVPAGIIGKLVVTPPNGMTGLSHVELRQMGVEIEPDAAPAVAQGYRRGSALSPGTGVEANPAPSPQGPSAVPPAVAMRPVAPPSTQAPMEHRQGEPQAFVDGLADRAAWESWIGTLSPTARAGAEFWAGQRSAPRPAACPTNDPVFESACVAARQRLTPTDVRRRAEPEYRRGWNSYVAAAPNLDSRPAVESPRSASGAAASSTAALLTAEAVVRPVAAMKQRLRAAGMAGLQASRQECEQVVSRNNSPRSAEYCLVLIYSAYLIDQGFMASMGRPGLSTPGWDWSMVYPALVRMFDVMQVPIAQRPAQFNAYERWISQELLKP